jgi:hypothetical protein
MSGSDDISLFQYLWPLELLANAIVAPEQHNSGTFNSNSSKKKQHIN